MLTISGRNFHGAYRANFRGPTRGFVLSDSQVRRYNHELCPFQDCQCGGGYGEGPDPDSAREYLQPEDCPSDCPADLLQELHRAWTEATSSPPLRQQSPVLLLPPVE